uniref:Uncharacterized protein n=1 Tax=Panagrolaimus superbus TaxID=310955 RepID=A0A914Y4N1_9BILA
MVRNATTVYLPAKYATYDVPWLQQQHSIFLYKSPTLTYNWSWFKELKIQGLDTTLSTVIELLDQHNCYFVAYGRGVKNIIIGAVKDRSLLEISGETTCNAFKIYNICKEYFDIDNCGEKPFTSKDEITMGNSNIMKMYDEAIIGPITLYPWGSTYETDRLQWSFSVNRGGIFDDGVGFTRFIDVTGHSQFDICHKSIIIPVQQKYWNDWCANSLLKTLEFYNLIADGFDASQSLHQFLTASIVKYFDTAIFQNYYCVNVLGGEFTPSQTLSYQRRTHPFCRYLTPDARRNRLIGIINTTLRRNLGDFWHRNVEKALADLHQFKVNGKPQRTIKIDFVNEIRQRQYQSSAQNNNYRVPYYPSLTPSPTMTSYYHPNRNYNNDYPQHTSNNVGYNRQTHEATTVTYNPPESTVISHEVKHYALGEYPKVLSEHVPDLLNPPTIDPPKNFSNPFQWYLTVLKV